MRQPRFLAPWKDEIDGKPAIYHCISRVVDRRMVLGKAEKGQFVRFMRLYEEFCGVHVLAFCVMTNHFHLLVHVPPRPAEGLSDAEFFRRLGLIYSELKVAEVRSLIEDCRRAGHDKGAEALKEKFLYRMWDLSQFMKVLKQRFTQWFNKRHERKGTLWEDRFKSVLVEGGYPARVIAAYIDLNPVRGGIVDDPAAYRWNSYSEAVIGKRRARQGLTRVMEEYIAAGTGLRKRMTWKAVEADYRLILFTDGEERKAEDPRTGEVRTARRGVSKQSAAQVHKQKGLLSRRELLRHQVRHFADGLVIGSRRFVDGVFAATRQRFGPKRTSGARKLRGTSETDLWSMRDLKNQ